MSIDCMFALNTPAVLQVVRPFYAQVIGWISIPLLCIVLPTVVLVAQPAWHRFRCWRRGVAPADGEVARTRLLARDNYFVSVVVSLYLVHPQITQKMFKLFSCRDLGGGRSYLQHDMQVDCNTLEFRLWQWGLGAPAIVLYGFGIPTAAFLVLYKNRRRLDQHAIKRKFSFLYRGYKQRTWYWESVVIVRKLLVAVVVSVLDGRPQIQGLLGLGILLTTLVVKLKLKPWDSSLLELVDFCAIVVSTVTIYGGLFFYMPEFLNAVDENVITYSLVFLNACFIAFFVVVYFGEWAVKILASLAEKYPRIANWRHRLIARYETLKRRYGLVERLDEVLSGKNDGLNISMKIRRLFRNGTADLHRLAADDRNAAVSIYRKAEARLEEERANKSRLPALASSSTMGGTETPNSLASPGIFAAADGDGGRGLGLGLGKDSGGSVHVKDELEGGLGKGDGAGAQVPIPSHSVVDVSPRLYAGGSAGGSVGASSSAQGAGRSPADQESLYEFAPIAPLWAMEPPFRDGDSNSNYSNSERVRRPPPPPSPAELALGGSIAPFRWEGREGELHRTRSAARLAVRSRTELLRADVDRGGGGGPDPAAKIASSLTDRLLQGAGGWPVPVPAREEDVAPREPSRGLPGTIEGEGESGAGASDGDREPSRVPEAEHA
eukprot:tig00000133_g7673.t1